jgi:hypothetical protein
VIFHVWPFQAKVWFAGVGVGWPLPLAAPPGIAAMSATTKNARIVWSRFDFNVISIAIFLSV